MAVLRKPTSYIRDISKTIPTSSDLFHFWSRDCKASKHINECTNANTKPQTLVNGLQNKNPLRAILKENFTFNYLPNALPKQDTDQQTGNMQQTELDRVGMHEAASFQQLVLYLPVEVDCLQSHVFGKLILPLWC